MEDNVLVDKGVYLGVTTNNQAEYTALKLALEECLKMGVKEVQVYMDSLLVVNQMKGIFKVKNRDLWPIHDAIKKLVQPFDEVSFSHVPREFNKAGRCRRQPRPRRATWHFELIHRGRYNGYLRLDYRLIACTQAYEESPGSIGKWQSLTATGGRP